MSWLLAAIGTGGGNPAYRVSGQQAARPDYGSVEGTISYMGDVPRLTVADDDGRRRPLLTVAAKTGGLQYAVVYLEAEPLALSEAGGKLRSPPPPSRGAHGSGIGPSTKSPEPPPVVIDQKDHTFVPHLVAIEAGRSIKFTNSDIINHNVRAISLTPGNEFNVYTGAGGGYLHRFDVDRRDRPVMLGCDIHPWMRGWIYIFNHPFFDVSDHRGAYRISNVPPGRYRLVVRQPRGGLSRRHNVRVEKGKVTRQDVRFKASDLSVD